MKFKDNEIKDIVNLAEKNGWILGFSSKYLISIDKIDEDELGLQKMVIHLSEWKHSKLKIKREVYEKYGKLLKSDIIFPETKEEAISKYKKMIKKY